MVPALGVILQEHWVGGSVVCGEAVGADLHSSKIDESKMRVKVIGRTDRAVEVIVGCSSALWMRKKIFFAYL